MIKVSRIGSARKRAWVVVTFVYLCLALVPAFAGPGDGTHYQDVLDMHGMAQSASDHSFNVFFDAGAWHGYSLPPKGDSTTGFVGPFVHTLGQGQWVDQRFAQVQLSDAATHRDITLLSMGGHSAPGYLTRRFSASGLVVRERLIFADSWHAVVEVTLTSMRSREVTLTIGGRSLPGQTAGRAQRDHAVVQTLGKSGQELITRVHTGSIPVGKITFSGASYHMTLERPLHLEPRKSVVIHVVQTLIQNPQTAELPTVDLATVWAANRRRWSGYLKAADSSHLDHLPDALARQVGAKAIVTLIDNWRAPRGDLHHDGVVPSWSNPKFNGFWAWDSWKNAAALAMFAPKLAEDQIRAMFDYQAANGMVPASIFRDKSLNNGRDSRPPLATWAVLKVYDATGDQAFLAEMYPKLAHYHRWWYADRDHDHNGLAEYGSTDGTKEAAKAESGMDNAVRFDHIRMVKNHDGAWSMDQESVDLNAYLYRDARGLARIAGILDKTQDKARWDKKAAAIKTAVRTQMFDPTRDWFFDVRLDSGKPVTVYGADGWIPLWAGLASHEQAAAVKQIMLDPNKFDTRMPLPSLARDNPHFTPAKGYWRGALWVDQALFGIQGLRRYGYQKQADTLARRLVARAKGLTRQAPMYENYDPLTGKGKQSRNFSWTAASYLLLLHTQAAGPR